MNYGIIPFDNRTVLGNYIIPEVDESLTATTITSIINAWNTHTAIDSYGRPWINAEGVHVVLRTSRANAKYLIAGLQDDQKTIHANALYVKGESICGLLDRTITQARRLDREKYIRYSQLLYIAIRDCSRARELRAEHYEYINKAVKTLKRDRASSFNIENDELTGDALIYATAEFSHIRSVSIYPMQASHVENGLVINKSTHNIITQNGINDETELLYLCHTNGWSTTWHQVYMNYIQTVAL
ncbi:hypothetical protein [Aeromonas veronii]|uniref:hypothetical protein n=1 Tax=Aeromonas veronii TaxID=654 RepID=UPI003BA196C3